MRDEQNAVIVACSTGVAYTPCLDEPGPVKLLSQLPASALLQVVILVVEIWLFSSRN